MNVADDLVSVILKCGRTEYYVDREVLLITESDVAYFYDALRGNLTYRSDHMSIFRIEKYLKCWLNNYAVVNRYQVLEWLYRYGMEDYRYEGELYRRLYMLPDVEIVYGYYMSFTSDPWIARDFSRGMYETSNTECVPYIFYVEDEALDLGRILSDVEKVTESRSMKEAIEDRWCEKEKIAYFDERCADDTDSW